MRTTALTVTALGTTATLCEMPESLLAEWEFVTDGLRGIGPIQGFTVTHPDAGVLGVILRKGRDCHAELRLLDQEEFLYAGAGRTLPYVLAHILRAHGSAGHPIPADAEPTPVTAEPVPDPVRVIARREGPGAVHATAGGDVQGPEAGLGRRVRPGRPACRPGVFMMHIAVGRR